MMARILLLGIATALAFSVCGNQSKICTANLIVPPGYTGEIQVVFDDANGIDGLNPATSPTYHYRVPDDGVLRFRTNPAYGFGVYDEVVATYRNGGQIPPASDAWPQDGKPAKLGPDAVVLFRLDHLRWFIGSTHDYRQWENSQKK